MDRGLKKKGNGMEWTDGLLKKDEFKLYLLHVRGYFRGREISLLKALINTIYSHEILIFNFNDFGTRQFKINVFGKMLKQKCFP